MEQKNNKNLSAANLQNMKSHEGLSEGVIIARDESVKEMEPMGVKRTYKELSTEFRELFPKAVAAFQLVPLMYDSLTTVDKMSHKNALKKIFMDHKDLEGFSRTNVYRSLPKDNQNIPRRVVPRRDKSSATKPNHGVELSRTKISSDSGHTEVKPTINEITSPNRQACLDCLVKMGKIEELEKALKSKSTSLAADNFVLLKDIQRELKVSIPFHDLRMHMIRLHHLFGEREPVVIEVTIDLTSNKVSYTLGKKRAELEY